MAQMPRRCITTFTRTVVKNRADLPNEIRGQLWLGNDEVMAFRVGDLVALAWRAAKKQQRVLMLSTECSARLVIVPACQSDSEPQTKPIVVHTCNQQMNGVDIADQHAVYYSLCKTMKWWRKISFVFDYRDSNGEQLCSLQMHYYPKKSQPPGLSTCNSRVLPPDILPLLCLAAELDVHANANILSNQSHSDWINSTTSVTEPLSYTTVLFAMIKLQKDAEQHTFALTLLGALWAHPCMFRMPLQTSHNN